MFVFVHVLYVCMHVFLFCVCVYFVYLTLHIHETDCRHKVTCHVTFDKKSRLYVIFKCQYSLILSNSP